MTERAALIELPRGEIKRRRREQRERELGCRQLAMPTRRYGVLLADPPWRFAPYSRETGLDRAADNHYPTMDIAELHALRLPAADDAVLFLWATVPFYAHAQVLLAHWGFEYASQFVWVKPRFGTGYWVRSRHELLLIGRRGTVPAPAMGTQFDSVIEAPAREHSRKPDRAYEIIETYFPTLPKIELFARHARAGWDSWGLEAPPP